MLSPAILGEVQTRNNRSFQSERISNLNDDLYSHPVLNNIVDKTSNAVYYEPRSYPYKGLYEDSSEERSESNERLDGSLGGSSVPYLRQEQPNFYKPYDFLTNNDNLDATPKSRVNTDSPTDEIQDSATNLYPSYHGGFPKAAFPHGPFLDKPYDGFHGFGPYGHHHHHYHPYGGGSSNDANSENNARENNGTNRAYGSPYFGNPYSPFPYGGYGDFYGPYPRNGNNSSENRREPNSPFPYGGYGDFYGPYPRNRNDSSENGRNRPYGYGPYNDGPDFYGPPGYGYGYGNSGNNNGNTNSERQTEGSADNDDQNNSTKNGYPPYGPGLVKPLLGTFPLPGFPSPFNLLPYDHIHGVFKGGPVVGVGPVGYPVYADPYLVGFPLHPYGPYFHGGKKYIPPKNKPDDSGETTMAPAGLTENATPERIIEPNEEEVAPAPSTNRFKTSGQKELMQFLIDFRNRKV